MRRKAYLKQLENDLERWAAQGLIDRALIPELLKTAGPETKHRSLAFILAVLGVILLACGAMIFVASNWQYLLRPAKLGILIGALWFATLLAAHFARRKRALHAEVAIIFVALIFGANVMLIGQIYHIGSHWPNGLLIWALGAMLAGIATPSVGATALAAVLFPAWSISEATVFGALVHWPFLPVLAGIVAFAHWRRSALIFHLAALSFLAWSVANVVTAADRLDAAPSTALVVLLVVSLALFLGGRLGRAAEIRYSSALENYGLIALAVIYFAVQFIDQSHPSRLELMIAAGLSAVVLVFMLIVALRRAVGGAEIGLVMLVLASGVAMMMTGGEAKGAGYVFGALYLAFIVLLIIGGLKTSNAFAINLAFVAFGAEVFYLYVETFNTLLGQSAFFIVGGLLFISAAVAIDMMRRRVLKVGLEATGHG